MLEASRPFHPLELAYRFLLAKGITTLSLGATNKKDFEFANKLRNSCEKLTTPEKNASFCQECNKCVPKCPSKLDIPNLLKETHNLLIENPTKRLWG